MKFILIALSVFVIGCKFDKKKSVDKHEYILEEIETIEGIKLKPTKHMYVDTSLVKKSDRMPYLYVSDGIFTDSLIAYCCCQKNKKNNTIFVQILTAIPTKKQLQKGLKKNTTLLQLYTFDLDSIIGQFKFLTIKLKDSLVQNIELYAKSTDKDYDGKDFESLEIDNYEIKISTFNYSIASNVYGNFEVVLPKGFGYFKNDTILKGYFECNNWVTKDKEQVKNWEINKNRFTQIE